VDRRKNRACDVGTVEDKVLNSGRKHDKLCVRMVYMYCVMSIHCD
jgi:hypothetical protein